MEHELYAIKLLLKRKKRKEENKKDMNSILYLGL